MGPKPRFTDGEKVLCFHGPLLYEAKCLRSQIRDKTMKYLIHYSGWNKNWDEWVLDSRVLKFNEANLQKQKELSEIHMKIKKTKSVKIVPRKETEKEPTAPIPIPSPAVDKTPKVKIEKRPLPSPASSDTSPEIVEIVKKKAKIEPEFVEEPKQEAKIDLPIPSVLQYWLIDDHDLINRQKKLLNLPSRITVDHIIASFVKEKVSVKGLSQNEESMVVSTANKIRDLFNVLLGKALLYKFERPQYGEVLLEYKESSMCQMYGAIHLLRMFTQLDKRLLTVPATEKHLRSLTAYLEDFIKYMSVNLNIFSLDDYVVASPEYHRRAL